MVAVVYDALGNRYAVLQGTAPTAVTGAFARHACTAAASDGVLVEAPGGGADAGVRVLNPDGSEAETSGNGVRIFACWWVDAGRAAPGRLAVRTLAGVVPCEVGTAEEGVRRVAATLGRPRFDAGDVPVAGRAGEVVEVALGEGYPDGWVFTAVNVGNPHAVVFGAGSAPATVRRWGPTIERDPRFPRRTNVQFVDVLADDRLRVGVWERGAGSTASSGSSACAAVAAAHRGGRCGRRVAVELPGGTLDVAVDGDGALRLAGPVRRLGRVLLDDEGHARGG